MYKLRITTIFFIILLCIPIVALPVQTQADSDVSAFSRLAGNSTPVITALTTCAIGKILGLATKAADASEAAAENAALTAQTFDIDAYMKADDAAQAAKDAWNKANCTTPIERAAAQVILTTLTQETVNWINGGMNGTPMFEQDPTAAFTNLQNQAVNDFKNILQSDSNAFPFGKDILAANMQSMNSTFATQNSSTLSSYLSNNLSAVNSAVTGVNSSVVNFGNSLMNGGWVAFGASLQPQNNPVGFNFQVQDQLSHITKTYYYSPAQKLKDELNWGKGFLSQSVCDNPVGIDGHDPTCKKSHIVTPGATISDTLSKALGAQTDTLNLGSDISADMASVMNAMFAKMLQSGLSSVTDSSDSTGTPATLTAQSTISGNATPGSLCGVQSSTDWYQQYPNFNFTGGGLAELKNREGLLATILEDQNGVLQKIQSAVYALDYCVPGPHPFTVDSVSGQTFGAILQNMPSNSNQDTNAQFLVDKLGLPVFPDHKVMSLSQVPPIVKTVTTRYFNAVDYLYNNRGSDGTKPVVADLIPEAADNTKYYAQLGYYAQTIADNQAKINIILATEGQLQNIQNQLSTLQSQDSSNGVDLTTDPKFISLQNAFNVMVPDLDVSPYSSTTSGQ